MRRALILPALFFASCHAADEGPKWAPGVVYATPREANARGFLDRRGLIHAHSVYSHDACDNMPVKDGVRDAQCFDDFRRGLCQAKHDFVFTTDHRESFGDTPFSDLLLYRAERGDTLLAHANLAGCEDGFKTLIMPGSESGIMPVGLEEHVSDDAEARNAIYSVATAEAIAILKQHGAVALVAHTEDWTVDQLSELPLDGFEMYNLHANTLLAAGSALELLVKLDQKDPGLPDPNLIFVNLLSEDDRYLSTWGTVLSRGIKRVTTMGTDCHRNTFPQIAQDGERIDSYRRMMIWFSNHLLVRADGSDAELKDALRAGRLYGAFEVLGYPRGFDYFVESGGEIGSEVQLSDRPVLIVKMPSIENLDPSAEAPVMRMRVLRAIEGGFEEVATGSDPELRFTPTVAGAYRAEVRMEPRHLTKYLGDYARTLAKKDTPWIYSNAIYVR